MVLCGVRALFGMYVVLKRTGYHRFTASSANFALHDYCYHIGGIDCCPFINTPTGGKLK